MIDALHTLASAVPFLMVGLFLLAGWSKLQADNQEFYSEAIQGYGVLPASSAAFMPRIIGLFELLLCVLLVLPATKVAGLWAAAALLLAYAIAFAKQLREGKADMDCGCAGPGAEIKISPALLLRNSILIGLCVFAVFFASAPVSVTMTSSTLVVLALIYLSSEQLIVNAQKIEKLQDI